MEIATGRGIVNKVAHEVNAGVLLLDMGLEEDIPESEGVQNLKVMHGSHYVGIASAMTEDEMLDALSAASRLVNNWLMKDIQPLPWAMSVNEPF